MKALVMVGSLWAALTVGSAYASLDIFHYGAQSAQSEFSPFATSGKKFVFDPRALRWYAYDHRGRVIRSGHAVGGANWCPDVGRPCRTPSGSFAVYSKGSAGCRSSKYPRPHGGAPMPYCMFFKGGYAIHGSYELPNHNASHGCIRVSPKEARWLSRNFIDHGTRVIVKPY